jgi:hypothetical protein
MLVSRRNIVQSSAAIGAATLGGATMLTSFHSSGATAAAALTPQLHTADANNFLVNSVILTGEKEALLVDTQFSFAHRLVANLLAAGKQLATVYITHRIPIITSESR